MCQKSLFTRLFAAAFVFFTYQTLNAQVAKASIRGQIKDAEENLSGASVVAMNLSTGKSYAVLTNKNGQYALENMMPNGTYKLSITFVGYNSEEKTGVNLSLDESAVFNFTLKAASNVWQIVNVLSKNPSVKTDDLVAKRR